MIENTKYKYTCKKCLQSVSMSKVIVKNNKLICPYCEHTLETDKFKVKQVVELQEAQNQEEE